MSMNCADCEQLLDAFLDGQLSGALRLEFEAHRLRCARCRQTVVMMESIGNIIACDQREPMVAPNFTDNVMAAVQAGEATRRIRMRRLAVFGLIAAQAAAVVGFLAWVRSGVPSADSPTARMIKVEHSPEYRATYAKVIKGVRERIDKMQAAGKSISSDLASLAKYADVRVPRDIARSTREFSSTNPLTLLIAQAFNTPAEDSEPPSGDGPYSL